MTSDAESDFPNEDLDSDVGAVLDELSLENIRQISKNITRKFGARSEREDEDSYAALLTIFEVSTEISRLFLMNSSIEFQTNVKSCCAVLIHGFKICFIIRFNLVKQNICFRKV